MKLLDFGLAKLAANTDSDVTRTIEGTVMGTAAYMAPEQAQGKPLDERSDIFSFGAVLYEMVSGNRAFSGDSMVDVISAVVRDEPKPLPSSGGNRQDRDALPSQVPGRPVPDHRGGEGGVRGDPENAPNSNRRSPCCRSPT